MSSYAPEIDRRNCRLVELGRRSSTSSTRNLPDDWRNLVRFSGLEPRAAIRAVTYKSAASLGLDDDIGLIAAGRAADLLTWNGDLKVGRVWRVGAEVSAPDFLGHRFGLTKLTNHDVQP